MANYKTLPGTYYDATEALINTGGQLFPARDEDGPFIHVCGQKINTYWPQQSRRRGYTLELAAMLGFDPERATSGRMVRWLVDEMLAQPHAGTYFDKQWHGLAKTGEHWHYLYCNPGRHGYCVEFDIRAAYWSAFVNAPSMLLRGQNTWLPDNGAKDSLAALMTRLPKPFRLTFLGILASWRSNYLVRAKNSDNPRELKTCWEYKVRYGAAFNAAHRAILRVYKLMQHLHRLVGDDCVRIHTDSILCKVENGCPWEQELFDCLKRNGFEAQIKGQGDTWLLDVNTGILGKKIIGAPRITADMARDNDVRINLALPEPTLKCDWQLYSPASPVANVEVDMSAIPAQTSLPITVKPVIKESRL